MIHLHLGAGALGLGLICPAVSQTDAQSYLINRSGSSSARIHRIRECGGYVVRPFQDRDVFVQLDGAFFYDAPEIDELATSVEDLILTTALKQKGVYGSLDQIARILAQRPAGAQTIVLAAENQIDSYHLRDALFELRCEGVDRAIFVRAVVDRICNQPFDDGAQIVVPVEQFAKIYFEKQGIEVPFLDTLPPASYWETAGDIQFVINRKKWIVNAAHLAATLYAHYQRYPGVKYMCERAPATRQMVSDMVAELVDIMSSNVADENQLRYHQLHRHLSDFGRTVVTRICDHPQRIDEAVTRFTGPESLFEFFIDYRRKLVEPYAQYMGTKPPFARIVPAMHAITIELISQERWIQKHAA